MLERGMRLQMPYPCIVLEITKDHVLVYWNALRENGSLVCKEEELDEYDLDAFNKSSDKPMRENTKWVERAKVERWEKLTK